MYLRGTISIINVYKIKHILNKNYRITIIYECKYIKIYQIVKKKK